MCHTPRASRQVGHVPPPCVGRTSPHKSDVTHHLSWGGLRTPLPSTRSLHAARGSCPRPRRPACWHGRDAVWGLTHVWVQGGAGRRGRARALCPSCPRSPRLGRRGLCASPTWTRGAQWTCGQKGAEAPCSPLSGRHCRPRAEKGISSATRTAKDDRPADRFLKTLAVRVRCLSISTRET